MSNLIIACAGMLVFCIILAIILITVVRDKNKKIHELEAVIYEAEDRLDALNEELKLREKLEQLSTDQLTNITHNGLAAAIDVLRK